MGFYISCYFVGVSITCQQFCDSSQGSNKLLWDKKGELHYLTRKYKYKIAWHNKTVLWFEYWFRIVLSALLCVYYQSLHKNFTRHIWVNFLPLVTRRMLLYIERSDIDWKLMFFIVIIKCNTITHDTCIVRCISHYWRGFCAFLFLWNVHRATPKRHTAMMNIIPRKRFMMLIPELYWHPTTIIQVLYNF